MKHSKSGLLLMEMIICIFFFALCAVVYSQIFLKSHVLSKNTISENHAVIVLENLAESYYNTHGDLESISLLYPMYAEQSDSTLRLYYDKDFNPLLLNSIDTGNPDSYTYIAELKLLPDSSSSLRSGTATFKSVSIDHSSTMHTEQIYSLDLTVNVPRTPASN